ncbi:MAG: FAD-dependent oxidoreductase [Clostridiales Family XIII bacterium]|jgi:glycine/D-amino acid oxidase-like deaminating enzyme|nr:FAD-dependent oxidoreductase [Clostridiales Family XIII bacterium]
MDKAIIERKESIHVSGSCEVLVAGGGIAGIAAALAAARNGKDVLLTEREYVLGGMATLGLVTIYLPLCDGEGLQLSYGIAEELLRLSVKHGAEANEPRAWTGNGSHDDRVKNRYMTQFNPHLFALEAEALLVSQGVRILYGTLACAVEKSGSRIEHVVIENKSGRGAIRAESVIDCTGDADVCARAGARTALHAGGNGLACWYYFFDGETVRLKMFGLADVVPEKDEVSEDGGVEAVQTESLDPSIRFSGVDGSELSEAVLSAHSLTAADILSYRAKNAAFVPVTISSVPLVRMSRRLVGAYTLDESENRVPMKDSIGMTGDWRRRGPSFEIPFGCLHGEETSNLLAAGRCISVTDAMWDITRVIPPCAVTGEAAGTAASLASDFTKMDTERLQAKLIEQGQKIHLADLP